jgi:hypothetical protein
MNRVVRWSLWALLALAARSPALAQAPEPPRQPAEAEPEVLIPGSARHGGWGGPIVQLSTVRNRGAVFVGGRGGWLVDGRFTLGGAGFGLANRVSAPPAVERPGEELDLDMGYGGLWLEYTARPVRLLHVSFGALVGGGGLSLRWHDGGSYGSRSEAFFVTEPAVVAELNLARSVRLDLGAAYRFVVGVDMPGMSFSDVSGPSVVVAMKFGKF